ncbi:uncharacterized protein N7459_006858 [Penicillium hispanicum]|uniref:uncharacterized protein n=1 Tax=Penicillium hispanicum TaxID=1080232 RepID=UPI002541CC13|nr:uncharacterized protein N7459_006858 [Penicillium hispanicum]KAJ5577894.1 hypothetical protein N7459_006858 [Penicillium hispanicum]
MLAVRDQENLVNTHQTAAAAKPLNQGVKQLPPKTPGKTPFKVPLNDENNPLAFGKRTVKGNGNRLDHGKLGTNAFVTPMEPRHRPVLGMKNTNQKVKGLQTPAPFGGTLKPEKTKRRTSTAQRIKKPAPVAQQAQPKVQAPVVQDDVPDIEYMPPKPTDLPDVPDDITYDTSFPQFRPKNRALGLESVYGKQEIGGDGLTKKQRKFQEDSVKYDKMVDEMIMKQLDSIGLTEQSEDEALNPGPQLQSARPRGPSANARSTRNISTLRSREAAAALSAPKPRTNPPRAAAAPKSRVPSVSSLLVPKPKTREPSNPSSMRNTAAAVNSNTTLGYSKGRSISSNLREKSTTQNPSSIQPTLSPETYMQLYGPPPLGSDMWTRCKAAGCFDIQEIGENQESEELLQTFGEDDEADSFQLTL